MTNGAFGSPKPVEKAPCKHRPELHKKEDRGKDELGNNIWVIPCKLCGIKLLYTVVYQVAEIEEEIKKDDPEGRDNRDHGRIIIP